MKPLNANDPGCNFTSSNCVIWQGPDIPCIKLCKGDSVSDVVFKLATELCNVLETLDINTYDISCLNLAGCAPANFHDFLQALINLICNLQDCCQNGGTPSPGVTTDAFLTQQMPVNPMYYYVNPYGDTVTTMTGYQYLTTLGNETANMNTRLITVEVTVAQHTTQINDLQNQVNAIPTNTTPQIVPTCVLPAVPTDTTAVLQALEAQFCQLQGATGNPSQIFQAIMQQCINLGADPTLGGGGGNMASIPGWDSNLLTLAAAINNMWLTLCDARSAIKNIQLNCCPTACNGIELTLFANLTGPNATLFVNGTIPSGFTNCLTAGALVTFTDDTGGSMTTNMDIVAYLNNPSGYLINLPSPPMNLSSNIHVKIDACLINSTTGTTCQRILEYTIVNQANCPVMVYTPTQDSISYSGATISGTNTYTVELWDNTGTTLIASQVQVITAPNLLAGIFAGLVPNTLFRVRVKITNASMITTDCQFTSVALIPTVLTPLSFGAAASFVALAGGGITETSGSGGTFIGDVGSDPTNTITGILPANVTGVLYTAANPAVIAAKVAVTNMIADAAARTPFTTIADAIGGTVITPGYYHTTGNTIDWTGMVTFDAGGDPAAVFIIYVTGNITVDAAATILLAGSAQWQNIFLVSSAGILSLGAGAIIKGNFIVHGDVTAAATVDLEGVVFSEIGLQTLNDPNFYNI